MSEDRKQKSPCEAEYRSRLHFMQKFRTDDKIVTLTCVNCEENDF